MTSSLFNNNNNFPRRRSQQFQMINNNNNNNNNNAQPRSETRSSYTALIDLNKNYNPFSLFQGFMSGNLKEEEQKIFPALSTFNYFKNISEVIFDKHRKIVAAYLENDPIWASMNWSDVTGNLGNNGFISEGIECSKVIDSFGWSMEELDKLSHELKATARKSDFGMKKSEFDLLKAECEKEYPTFYIKNIMKQFNPTILEYNTKFLTFLGYEPSDFAAKILRHGVPEIYPNMQKKYAALVKETIGLLLNSDYDGKPIEKQIKLLHNTLQVRNVIEKIFLMRSFNKDGDFEIEMFFVYESLGEPMKIEEEFTQPTFQTKEFAPSRQMECEEFLKKFYNIKKKDESDAARTCRIRYL